MRIVNLLSFIVIFLFSGCLSTVSRPDVLLVGSVKEIPSIQEAYAERLRKLDIGINLPTFIASFPEAYVGGQSGKTTAYEVSKKTQYALKGDWNPYYRSVQDFAIKTNAQLLWFYFYEGKLVKWGRPQDWPAHPDQVIEVRNR